MLVGFVAVNAAGQPQDFLGTQHGAELFLDLRLGHVRISAGTAQAAFCGENRSLAVAVNAAAFQNEITAVIAVGTVQVADFSCRMVVLVPRKIQPVHQTAPRIEAPVDAADSALGIADESGADISCPGVVGFHFHKADFRRQHCPCGFVLFRSHQHGDFFGTGNGCGNCRKGFSCRPAAASPGISPCRPDQQTAGVPVELRRHAEPVCAGCCM